MAKKIVTTLEEPQDNIEVTLVDQSYSSVIINGCIINFTEGKAVVSKETADRLRKEQIVN